jgi:ABC-type polysaccharide/polyol phosphate transport system ATPase subunit
VRGLAPLEPQPLAYDKPLCASLDGFTLHAATRAGGLDPAGREALRREATRTLLDIPDLEIPEGQITALVGASGAGKTTLLRLLALLDRPQRGELRRPRSKAMLLPPGLNVSARPRSTAAWRASRGRA